jgi:succinate dehydrogenase/fumarate reductase flavoprotein subunit
MSIGLTDNENQPPRWPYPIRYGRETGAAADVLVLGGGIAGCWAAISAAKMGMSVLLVDKAHVRRSGAGGSGCDHWQFAATNPACRLTPEELAQALVENHGGWNCGIHRYIQCREGWDALLELEDMGVKIRDSEAEFEGADFRDASSGLLFGYDYQNRYTIRFWGTQAKPALEKECLRVGVKILNRVMVTSLLTDGGKQGARVVGATGFNVCTGEFYSFKGKATVLCLSRPEQMWAFSTELNGLSSNFMQNFGDGHAMAWKAGAEFTLMERSIPYPGAFDYPYDGYARPFAEWHACTVVDSNGKEVPYIDRDGRVLTDVRDRYSPSPGQKFFLAGGGSGPGVDHQRLVPPDHPAYKYMAPSIKFPDVKEKIARGVYTPPLWGDLTTMPKHERRVIFGLSVGQDGKTDIAVYKNYTAAGFDPDNDMLQCISDFTGVGPPQWRAPWFNSGGLVVDWALRTNLEGLFAAGQQLFASEDHANAATSGRYAGRMAAEYVRERSLHPEPQADRHQVEEEMRRVYAPIRIGRGIEWKELQAGIARVMQEYCGEKRNDELITIGLRWLDELKEAEAADLCARNPHELMRALETMSVLTCGEMIMHASLARRASNSWLNFVRLDFPEVDPPEWDRWITTRLEDDTVRTGSLDMEYWGDLETNYQKHNAAYGPTVP